MPSSPAADLGVGSAWGNCSGRLSAAKEASACSGRPGELQGEMERTHCARRTLPAKEAAVRVDCTGLQAAAGAGAFRVLGDRWLRLAGQPKWPTLRLPGYGVGEGVAARELSAHGPGGVDVLGLASCCGKRPRPTGVDGDGDLMSPSLSTSTAFPLR